MDMDSQKIVSLKRLVGGQNPPEKGTTWLAVVFGVCTDARLKNTDAGSHMVFSGDWLAKGLVTKAKKAEALAVRAGALVLPTVAEEMLLANDVGAEGTFTELGLKVGITKDDKGRPQYVAEYLHKPVQSSPAEAVAKQHGAEYFGAPAQANASKAAGKGR